MAKMSAKAKALALPMAANSLLTKGRAGAVDASAFVSKIT